MKPRICKLVFTDTHNYFDNTEDTQQKGGNMWLYTSGPKWFDNNMLSDTHAIPVFKMMQHEDALGDTCVMSEYCIRSHIDDSYVCDCAHRIDNDFPILFTGYERYDLPELTKEDPIWNFEIWKFMFLREKHIVDDAVKEALNYAHESIQASLYKDTLDSSALSRPFFMSSAKYNLMRQYNPAIDFEKLKKESYTITFHSVTPGRDPITGGAYPYHYMITDSIGQIEILNPSVFNIPDFRVYEPDFLDINYYKRDAILKERED